MSTTIDLSGKTAIVTGAGQGIGLAIALKLASAGARLVVAEFNEATGKTAVQEIEATGGTAIFVQTDVRDPQNVEAMVATVVERFGQIDILVNNAGIVKNTPAEDTPDDVWRSIIDVNLNGVYWCCRAIGKQMLEQGYGSIVNVASMSGLVANKPQPQAAYNASKAAVIMLTRSLAGEWSGRGLRINSVSPGYIGTELVQEVLKQSDEWHSIWHSMTPMGRIGVPEDVANAVLFLASDMASYATGTNLVIDGGYTSW